MQNLKINYMKKIIFIISIFIVTASYAQNNYPILKSNFDFGDGIVLSTYLNVQEKGKEVVITSPKNADYRMFGNFKGILARLLGKSPKKGIIITINNKLINDSLIGKMHIPMFGYLKFKGVYKNGVLNGNMIKNDTTIIGTIKGTKYTTDIKRIENYSSFYPKIIEITEKNIFSKSFLQTKKWIKNKKKIKKLLDRVQDDIDLYIGFNMLGYKMPFSHYGIFIQKDDNDDDDNPESDESDETINNIPTVFFEKKDNSTAYLKIKDFETSQKELSEILPQIVNSNYQNLIIDLRDNGGGGLDAAFEFAKYITDKDIVVGYFVTNKLQYSSFQLDIFQKLPVIKMQSIKEFISSLREGKGSKLVFHKNNNPVYQGNLYILTNKNTASTCEPIVYLLKQTKRATIVGENTAGAMLSADFFKIYDKYKLYIPIADFYTYDGVRLEGVGVKPNIETKSENALNKTLEIIKQNGKK